MQFNNNKNDKKHPELLMMKSQLPVISKFQTYHF